jgi:carbonic anhydrase
MCLLCKRNNAPDTENVSPSRRSILGAAAAGALMGLGGVFGQVRAASAYKPANVLTPDEALARLMQGNERYASNQTVPRDFDATRPDLAAGQNPYACVLGCADSRVGPELCFDEARGDLFVTRVAGNYVTNDMLASLEYGVAVLKAKFIMVLGHTSCGAISAAVSAFEKNTAFPGHIQSIATALKPAVSAAAKSSKGGNLLEAATKVNIQMNVKRLQESTPVLRNLVRTGALKVAGGLYHLDTGRVELIS